MGWIAAALAACWMAGALAREAGRRFESRDAREAEALLRSYASPRGDLLSAVERDARATGPAGRAGTLVLRGESVSLAYRHARVWVHAAPGLEYSFDVDLSDRSIHPGNPAAERVLRALLAAESP